MSNEIDSLADEFRRSLRTSRGRVRILGSIGAAAINGNLEPKLVDVLLKAVARAQQEQAVGEFARELREVKAEQAELRARLALVDPGECPSEMDA